MPNKYLILYLLCAVLLSTVPLLIIRKKYNEKYLLKYFIWEVAIIVFAFCFAVKSVSTYRENRMLFRINSELNDCLNWKNQLYIVKSQCSMPWLHNNECPDFTYIQQQFKEQKFAKNELYIKREFLSAASRQAQYELIECADSIINKMEYIR